MFRALASRVRRVGARAGKSVVRPAVVRAASVLAIAGMLFAPMAQPQPAEAHASHAYTLEFYRLRAISESNEWGSDEPYVLFFVGNLSGFVATAAVKRTNVFGDVDDGENRYQTVRLWGTGSSSAALPGNNPDNLIVLVQVMEHDSSTPDALRATLQAIMGANIAQYQLQGWSRSQIVSQLKLDMAGTINALTDIPVHNDDDRVGGVQELRITAADVTTAHGGTTVEKSITVNDGGDGHYRSYFRFQRDGSGSSAAGLGSGTGGSGSGAGGSGSGAPTRQK